MKRPVSLVGFAALAIASCIVPGMSVAQDYPNRPIKLIIPFAPGGTTDLVGRIYAQALQERLGQPVLVDNRPGAGSQIGTDAGAKAVPDGYTLLFGPADGLSIIPAMKKKVPYDPNKDFTPISMVATSPMVFVVNAQVPANSLAELIAYAKARPDTIRYASAGVGSILHLTMALLGTNQGLQMVHVPYKGGGPALNDLIAGQVDMMAGGPATAAKHVDSGRVRILAQTGRSRHPMIAGAPTTAELGYRGIAVESWFGLLGPLGLPQPIVERLLRETNAVLDQAAVKQRFIDAGCIAAPAGPAEFAQFIAEENRKWSQVVKAAGIPPQD